MEEIEDLGDIDTSYVSEAENTPGMSTLISKIIRSI